MPKFLLDPKAGVGGCLHRHHNETETQAEVHRSS